MTAPEMEYANFILPVSSLGSIDEDVVVIEASSTPQVTANEEINVTSTDSEVEIVTVGENYRWDLHLFVLTRFCFTPNLPQVPTQTKKPHTTQTKTNKQKPPNQSFPKAWQLN